MYQNATYLHFVGCIKPEVLLRRLEKEDIDGLFDRHTRATRLERYFEDLTDMDEDENFERMFRNIFHNHHDGQDSRGTVK